MESAELRAGLGAAAAVNLVGFFLVRATGEGSGGFVVSRILLFDGLIAGVWLPDRESLLLVLL